ncbi:MAG: histidine--tRNA ligase [Clostridia bacterium]|nr:histidine--tRNA ligase [Clostridia bacterium]MDD4685828.1 histidine--tRNA ligase [Clostridia bacterium]
MQKAKARTLSGFMELLPQKQIIFNQMKDKIISVFKLNGLAPMDTPVLEYSDVLLAKAGGETEKQIYQFNKGSTDLCMRFDLTVPFAKYVSLYQNELTFPFRRYQVGKVFRGERAQKGRFREFYQCDIDIIDNEKLSLHSDAECIDILSQVYDALEQPILIKVNNRKIINGLLENFKLTEKTTEILILLDKKSKLDKELFLAEFNKITPMASEIIEILNSDTPQKLAEFNITNKTFLQGISEIQTIFKILQLLEVKNEIIFDLFTIRGLAYYTGTVFEAFLKNIPEQSSVSGGGRYDNLTESFSNKGFYGVGISIGLTRLFDLLDKNNLLEFSKTTTTTLALIPLTNIQELTNHCYGLSKQLKNNGINTEVLYFEKTFKNKLNYANKKKIPFIIVVGDDEIQNGSYSLKNMETGETVNTSLQGLIELLGGKA